MGVRRAGEVRRMCVKGGAWDGVAAMRSLPSFSSRWSFAPKEMPDIAPRLPSDPTGTLRRASPLLDGCTVARLSGEITLPVEFGGDNPLDSSF